VAAGTPAGKSAQSLGARASLAEGERHDIYTRGQASHPLGRGGGR
jgi:hypothetical protein